MRAGALAHTHNAPHTVCSGVHTPSGLRSTIKRPAQCTRSKPVAGAMNGPLIMRANERMYVHVHTHNDVWQINPEWIQRLITNKCSGACLANLLLLAAVYCGCCLCSPNRAAVWQRSLSLVAILLHTMDQRPLIKTRARAHAHRQKRRANCSLSSQN